MNNERNRNDKLRHARLHQRRVVPADRSKWNAPRGCAAEGEQNTEGAIEMKNTELIVYLMGEYQSALKAIEEENDWNTQEDKRIVAEAEENNDSDMYVWRRNYNGRHVPKAELTRIRLMLQKSMLEVERNENLYKRI